MKHSKKQLFALAAAAGLAVAGISAAEPTAAPTAQIGYVLSEDYGVPFQRVHTTGFVIASFFCRRASTCVRLGMA